MLQEVQLMNNKGVLIGASIGAAVAYMIDPDRGARRRALVRDKLVRAARVTREAAGATSCDLTNRARGIVAATRGRLTRERPDDITLAERVRARLGRVTSHPHAIDVDAVNGEVTLSGPILASEVNRVLSAVGAVRGVKAITKSLQEHEGADGVPSLRGEGRIAKPSLDLLHRSWAPATRAIVAMTALATAGAAVAYARR
jgi:hypothetical protein